MTKTIILAALCLSLSACGGGDSDNCALDANKAAGWYQEKDGKWHSYVIDGCGQRVETPLPQGLTPVQN